MEGKVTVLGMASERYIVHLKGRGGSPLGPLPDTVRFGFLDVQSPGTQYIHLHNNDPAKPLPVCFRCEEPGHLARDCLAPAPNRGGKN